jgi:FkbM family methyltransferase
MQLAALLRVGDGGDAERRLAVIRQRLVVLRQRLHEAHATMDRWKKRVADVTAHARALEGRRASVERKLKQELSLARRETPAVPVYRETFLHRRHTLSARVDGAAAKVREDGFRRVSATYRAALERTPDALGPSVHRMPLDGLTWWFPLKVGKTRVTQAWIDKQRLPYHGVLMTHVVAAGGIMLDLGANIGRMSISRAILGDVTAAYCAEPDPLSYACLARNVIDNGLQGLVLPDQTAIGDRDGVARLLRCGTSGHFRVVSVTAEMADTMIDVPCTTLDRWVAGLGIDLDAVTFIKVDVEGSERRLVAGANRVMGCSHIAWQMEIYPAALQRAGDDAAGLYAELKHAFTHFIDLNRRAEGRVVRRVSDLTDALRYIGPDGKTDVLLFSASTFL